MSKKIILGIVLLLLIVGGSLFIWRQTDSNDGQVKASGTIEVTEVSIMPLAGGRLLVSHIEEGQFIEKNKIVAKLSLDGLDERKEVARAHLNQTVERLKELRSGARDEEIAEAKAHVNALEAKASQAIADRKRYKKLEEEGVVSSREAELFTQRAQTSREELKAAQAQLALLKKGNRKETIAQQESIVEAAKAALRATEIDLGHKEIRSPVSGIILTKNYEVGEVVGIGSSLATVGVMNDCWLKVYIPSTQMGRIRIGGAVDVRIDSYPKRSFIGKVSAISQQAEYNPRLSLTQDERANQVFWVKIALSNDEGIMKPGMPADAIFQP